MTAIQSISRSTCPFLYVPPFCYTLTENRYGLSAMADVQWCESKYFIPIGAFLRKLFHGSDFLTKILRSCLSTFNNSNFIQLFVTVITELCRIKRERSLSMQWIFSIKKQSQKINGIGQWPISAKFGTVMQKVHQSLKINVNNPRWQGPVLREPFCIIMRLRAIFLAFSLKCKILLHDRA